MKKDVVDYLAKCMKCQRVNTTHRHPTSLLERLAILEWKWEVVIIDFIIKLLKTTRKHDSIIVAVDKLTKVVHFLLIKLTHKAFNIA
jgi:hypothetical protein